VHPVATGIGFASIVLLWLGEKFLPNRPIALLVVILSTTFISVTNLASQVATVGDIPSGLSRRDALSLQNTDINSMYGRNS